MDPDSLRIVALILCGVALAVFPMTVAKQGRPWCAWFAVIGAEVILFAQMVAVADHWGEPLVWYRTPAVMVSSLLFLTYTAIVFRQGERSWVREPSA